MKSFLSEQLDQINTTLHRVEHRVQRHKQDSEEHSAELQLDFLAVAYQQEHPKATYSEAFEAVMQDNPDLKAEYAASFGHASPRQAREFNLDTKADTRASDEVDRLAMELHRQHPGLSYESCLGRVRESHPELFKRFQAEKG